MATFTHAALTITQNPGFVTAITQLLVRSQDQARITNALIAYARDAAPAYPGLIALAVHHSTDGERVLMYGQWRSEADLRAADRVALPLRGLALATDVHLYDVIYTNDVTNTGVTALSPDNEYATFINVMHTTPDQQSALVDYVIGNDDAVFTPHPGFRSANFHRSRDGERVVNYSHWNSEASFLDAINGMMHVPGLTMRRANELAAQNAGERGWTDFHFYTVDAVIIP